MRNVAANIEYHKLPAVSIGRERKAKSPDRTAGDFCKKEREERKTSDLVFA